ncbi:hypothetical protein KAU43_09485, partial [candidate division WOR-3 bacterium]|nr:hypothetical protein [candidate division WOR-3 bacterium]
MKKSFLILLLALFVVNFAYSEYVSLDNKAYLPYEVNIISQTTDEVIVEFKLNSFEVDKITIKGKEYSKINIPGVINYLEKGKPELPHINRNVIISDVGKVTFKVIDSEIITREFLPPVPSKGNLLRNIDPSTVPYTFAKDYNLAVFPSIYIDISEPFIMRKFRGTNISFSPIIYNPKKTNYTVYKRIVVSIKTAVSKGINEISRTDLALKIDKDFENIYRNNFINYSEIISRYPAVTEQGKMLIITDDGFYNTMMPFYLWKLKKGIPCEMVNLSTIGNNEPAIKNFIQTKFDSDTIAYILLVGDAEDVSPGTGTIGDANGEVSDPVYTYLAGSDYYPDAIIGRFSSSNATDIANMVNRSIEYEMNPTPAGTWYHKAAGVSSNEGSPSDEERITWEKDTLLAHNTYESVDILVEGQANLQSNISAAFNEGRGLGY